MGEITRALWKDKTKQGLGLCVSALKVVNPLECILTHAINQVNVKVPFFVWVHPLFGLFTPKLGDFKNQHKINIKLKMKNVPTTNNW